MQILEATYTFIMLCVLIEHRLVDRKVHILGGWVCHQDVITLNNLLFRTFGTNVV